MEQNAKMEPSARIKIAILALFYSFVSVSRFADTLRQLIAKNGLKQHEIEALSGVHRSLISRMLRDRVPTRAQLAGLCAAISPDATERASLLFAHLRDEADLALQRAGIDHRDIILALPSGDSAEQPPAWFDSLPDRLQVELALIAEEALRTPELRDMVSSLAALVERHAEEARRLRLLPGVDCEIPNAAAVAETPAPYGEPEEPRQK